MSSEAPPVEAISPDTWFWSDIQSASEGSRLSAGAAARSSIPHKSLLAISSSRFARSTSFCEMPPASWVVKSTTTWS